MNNGVHDLVVFGDLAGGVQIGEPSQRCVGALDVVGLVDLVELLERVPRGTETWMSLEEPIQVLSVGVAEMVISAQEREAGPEQLRFVCWGPQLWVAALYLPGVPG